MRWRSELLLHTTVRQDSSASYDWIRHPSNEKLVHNIIEMFQSLQLACNTSGPKGNTYSYMRVPRSHMWTHLDGKAPVHRAQYITSFGLCCYQSISACHCIMWSMGSCIQLTVTRLNSFSSRLLPKMQQCWSSHVAAFATDMHMHGTKVCDGIKTLVWLDLARWQKIEKCRLS